MLCQRRLEGEFNCVRQSGNAQSQVRPKDKDRDVAGRMHEGRLHKRKPEDIPQAGQRNSFSRAVRSTESAVQEDNRREEDPSLI